MRNQTPPLVSIVVPSYNYGHLIGETLDSLMAQTYQHWECVVVDDGSTDNTREVVSAYAEKEPRIRYIRQENARQAAARNNGIRHSSGAYFQFLDADDLIEKQKLERQVAFLEQHPDTDIVYSGARYFTTENRDDLSHSRSYSVWDDGQPWMTGVSGHGHQILPRLLRNNITVVNSPLVRRQVIEEVGNFDESITPVEDWDYWTRCALKGKHFEYDDAEDARALVRAHELSSSLDGRRMMRSTLSMRKIWATKTLRESPHLQINRDLIAEGEGLLGVEEAMQGHRLKGILQIIKAATLARQIRHRAKWLACALVTPFASKDRLRKFVSTPVSESLSVRMQRLNY